MIQAPLTCYKSSQRTLDQFVKTQLMVEDVLVSESRNSFLHELSTQCRGGHPRRLSSAARRRRPIRPNSSRPAAATPSACAVRRFRPSLSASSRCRSDAAGDAFIAALGGARGQRSLASRRGSAPERPRQTLQVLWTDADQTMPRSIDVATWQWPSSAAKSSPIRVSKRVFGLWWISC